MRRASPWLLLASGFTLAFLYLPLLVVVAYSFNDSRLNAEWVGFTLHWYRALFADEAMLAAARNSLLIALVASAAATLLGTLAGLAMHRWHPRWLPLLVVAPVAMPEVLLGVSLLIFFLQVLHLTLGFVSVVLAHITFSIGFVALVVRTRMTLMDESIFEAARDLGATPWQTFRRHLSADPAGRGGRGADGLHALAGRFRDQLLHRRGGRFHAAAADLLDDQDRRHARGQCGLHAADAAHAEPGRRRLAPGPQPHEGGMSRRAAPEANAAACKAEVAQ